MITSYLYGYGRRFLHVRIQLPGRPHTSPRHFESIEAGECQHSPDPKAHSAQTGGTHVSKTFPRPPGQSR